MEIQDQKILVLGKDIVPRVKDTFFKLGIICASMLVGYIILNDRKDKLDFYEIMKNQLKS